MLQFIQEHLLDQFLDLNLINLAILRNVEEVIQLQVDRLQDKAFRLVDKPLKQSRLRDRFFDSLCDLVWAFPDEANNVDETRRLYNSLDVIIEFAVGDEVVDDLPLDMI